MPPRVRILMMMAAVVEVDLTAESSDTQIVDVEPAPADTQAVVSGDAAPETKRSPQAPPRTLRDLFGLPAGEVRRG